MTDSAVAPDWSPFQFEQGRFEVIHNLLNAFEKRIAREGPDVDRSEYLALCHSDNERNIMRQEMDYLCALLSQPVRFVGGCLIIKTIAVGGFGVVSQGVDPSGRSVAVKVSHLSWQLPKNRDELDQEAMILRELSHPNIVEFIDCGYNDNWYLITEWVNGYNLSDAIRKIRAPLVQWLDIFCQVCDALDYGHQQGIIHRDINLRNIMVTGTGKPLAKVLDYGVAKRSDLSQSHSRHVKGTREFIAPEQYNGECDERSDIYALGVTLQKVVESQYSHPARIPGQLQTVIRKATARKPSKRYQTAVEFRSAIQDVIDGIANGKYPLVFHRNRFTALAVTSLAVVAIALLAMVIGKGWFSNKQPDSVAHASQAINPLILLKTDPPGAHLTFYRLVPDGPDPASGIVIGTARTSQEIPPGDYLVVAVWPNGEWTEVLRRIPTADRYGLDSLPVSSFDAFRSGPLGTEIAKIKKVSFVASGMMEMGDFWVDVEVTDESRKPVVASSFGYACEVLEAQGKRLPLAKELESIRKSGKIRSTIDEWTCSIASESSTERTLENGLNFRFQFNGFVVFPADESHVRYQSSDFQGMHFRTVGFRGIRNLQPFGASSN